MQEVKFPEVEVQLTGQSGNAFAILGAVQRELKRAGYGEYIPEFMEEAQAGSYEQLLATVMRWVEVA